MRRLVIITWYSLVQIQDHLASSCTQSGHGGVRGGVVKSSIDEQSRQNENHPLGAFLATLPVMSVVKVRVLVTSGSD